MIASKWKWIAGGAGVLGLLLWSSKKASAQTAPPGLTATVVVPISKALPQGGVVVRTEPSTRGGRTGGASGFGTLVAPEGSPLQNAFTGTVVRVLETGINDADGATGGEWWKIVTPGGATGYARAVGPDGAKNMTLNSQTTVSGSGELLHRMRTAQSRNLPHVAAQYHDHYINALVREGRVRA